MIEYLIGFGIGVVLTIAVKDGWNWYMNKKLDKAIDELIGEDI